MWLIIKSCETLPMCCPRWIEPLISALNYCSGVLCGIPVCFVPLQPIRPLKWKSDHVTALLKPLTGFPFHWVKGRGLTTMHQPYVICYSFLLGLHLLLFSPALSLQPPDFLLSSNMQTPTSGLFHLPGTPTLLARLSPMAVTLKSLKSLLKSHLLKEVFSLTPYLKL